ncbi:MAG: lipid-A-disaccharide synthase N-terminal domain-containing protein [Mariniphaga sp.]
MTTSPLWIYAIGFTAQVLFTSRMVVQWIQSEKAGKPISPLIFWQLSLLGSILFLAYGILRHDFAIVLGQALVYYIYVRNLHFKDGWSPIPILFKIIVVLAPLLTIGYLLSDAPGNLSDLFTNKEIPTPLQIWGIVGQLIFTFRFYVQWVDSETKNESVLSKNFWTVSLVGCLMMIVYAVFRYDPVLFLGQLSGLIVYVRNLILGKTAKG